MVYKLICDEDYIFAYLDEEIPTPELVEISKDENGDKSLVLKKDLGLNIDVIVSDRCFSWLKLTKAEHQDPLFHNIKYASIILSFYKKNIWLKKYIEDLYPRDKDTNEYSGVYSNQYKQTLKLYIDELSNRQIIQTLEDKLDFLKIIKKVDNNVEILNNNVLYLFHLKSKINHSCTPNATFRQEGEYMHILPNKLMKKGTEITLDYTLQAGDSIYYGRKLVYSMIRTVCKCIYCTQECLECKRKMMVYVCTKCGGTWCSPKCSTNYWSREFIECSHVIKEYLSWW